VPSRFHRARQRRVERAASESSSERLNLVPLVDILTSIVFYALLTVATAGGASLLSFDVSRAPDAAQVESAGADSASPAPITVTVYNDRTVIQRGAGDAGLLLLAQPAGLDRAALERLEATLAALHRGADALPAGTAAVVIPADDVSYERVVGVLERLRRADFRDVSLGMVARKG
jgi:biopolymer transport protein ExbD